MARVNMKNMKKRSGMVIMLACFILLLLAGTALAKYIAQNKEEAEMLASNFHISSNYLEASSENAEYTVSDWGEKGIDIQLYNYETENVALVAEEEIQYTITLDDASGWQITVWDETDQEVQASADGEYTLPGDGRSKASHRLHLQYTGEGEPDPVAVTVETTAPYVVQLSAEFELYGYAVPDFIIEDQGTNCLITLHTNDYEDAVKIQWDASMFSPDNTNQYMAGWKDEDAVGSVDVNAYSTYEFIFVKKTTQEFKKVTGSGTTIPMKVGE